MEVGALKQMFLYNSEATIMEITRYQLGVGSLMYLMTQSRLDLSITVSILSRFSHNLLLFH
jgi:hypothetical protein